MDDAYALYRDEGRPKLVPSAVLFLDVLGTQNVAEHDEQARLEMTHAAFAQAREWGESKRGATEITVATWFTDNLVMACPAPPDGDPEEDNNDENPSSGLAVAADAVEA